MTEIYYPENSTVKVWTYVDKEVASPVVNGTAKTFDVANDIANVTGLGTSPLPDKNGGGSDWAIRDFAVYYRKNGSDTRVTDAFTVGTGTSADSISFTTAPTTVQADNVILSYSHTPIDITFILTDYSDSGAERTVEQIITYGGHSIDQEKPQTQKEFELTTIKNGLTLSEAVNGAKITTTTEVSTMTIDTVVGGATRLPRTIKVEAVDPIVTTNKLILLFRGIRGVSKGISAAAEDYYEETVSFSCKPEEYGEITVKLT
jgi:hypothetical protein